MRLKHTALRLAGAAMIAAAVVPWLGGSVAQAAVTVHVDQKWIGTSATDAGLPQADCAYSEIQQSHTGTGWHFVLTGTTGLTSFTAYFQTAGAVTVTTTETAQGVIVQGGKGAVVYTATADTLVAGPSTYPGDGTSTGGEDIMQLSHICEGTTTPPSSPPPTTTSAPPTTTSAPPTTTSAPPTTTSAPPTTTSAPVTTSVAATTASQSVSVLPTKIENTTASEEASPETSVLAESEQLPHTGGGIPYTALIVLSLGLLLAGGALLLLPGLSVERANRRH